MSFVCYFSELCLCYDPNPISKFYTYLKKWQNYFRFFYRPQNWISIWCNRGTKGLIERQISLQNDTEIEQSNYIFGNVLSLFSADIFNLCRCHVSRQIKETAHRVLFRADGFLFAGGSARIQSPVNDDAGHHKFGNKFLWHEIGQNKSSQRQQYSHGSWFVTSTCIFGK